MFRQQILHFSIGTAFLAMAACTQSNSNSTQNSAKPTEPTMITIDGSSTVYPLTEAVAEEFQAAHRDIRVAVGFSGTGGGMKKFMNHDIDITGASREIKDVEIEMAKTNQVNYIELKVAFDGLSVVVNPKNNFVDQLTTQELQDIWKAGSTIQTWKDVRATWPDEEIKLYGPGTDSGTFDYFKEAILGKDQPIRSDFTSSENDHIIVQGVTGDEYSLGFFGYAYYLENQERLNIVPIVHQGKPAVMPSPATIKDGSYAPLSRPLYVYVNKDALKKKEVRNFMEFYLSNTHILAPEVGYVALDDETLEEELSKLKVSPTTAK
jgi:phosphate transport system substrate-binding protein